MNQITDFWNYFKQKNFVFLLINEIPIEEFKNYFEELVTLLHLYNKNLDIIIKNKESEIIITAGGNPYLFKEVELLVHHAPATERWKIIAFLQPEQNVAKYENRTHKPFQLYGINLCVSEIYFLPVLIPENPTCPGIRIYLKNFIIYKDSRKFREAVYILLEHLIGEKSFAIDIAFIDIVQLPSNHEKIKSSRTFHAKSVSEKIKKTKRLIVFKRTF